MKTSKKIFLLLIQLVSVWFGAKAQSNELEKLYEDQYSLLKVKDFDTKKANKMLKITMSKGHSYAVVLQPAESEEIPVVLLTKNQVGSTLIEGNTEEYVMSSNYQEGRLYPTIHFRCMSTGIYTIDLSKFKGRVYTLWKVSHEEKIG